MKSLQRLFILSFLCCVYITINAAEPVVKVLVATDHADWVYQINEKVKFKISVVQDGKVLSGVKVQYEIGPEKMPPIIKNEIVLKAGETEIEGGTMKVAGFLRCKVKAEVETKKYEGLATAAFNVEQIKPTTTMPTDFSEFWTKAIAENAKITMDVKMELLPEKCTELVNVYQVNLQNCKIGMRLYGILCVPKVEGKYPAVLQVPGAGVRPYNGDIKLAEKGIITFQIGIHGIPVNLAPIVYDNLRYGALDNYPSFNMDNRDNYFYKHVYLGCLRANDFICSLPQYDGENLMVMGGSQGGALSIVTAALDKRVKALSCFYPALCDLNGYQSGRAGGWPHLFNKKEFTSPEKIETSRYYDVVNFARLISVPGFYSFGYNDETCPPTSMYSAFNSISTQKSFFIAKETGHFATPEQYAKQWEYVLDHFNIKR
jgi:cephalosporin-C deacetylase-like acetyl esterase